MTTATENRLPRRQLRPGPRRGSPRPTCPSPARSRPQLRGPATCATGPTRSSTPTRRCTTGSPATGCSTRSSCATARRSRTATAGCAPTAPSRRWARTRSPASPTTCSSAGRARPTPTSSRTPGKILALVEVCLPTEVRPDLSTVGRYDFGGKLRSPMTAHPKIDPVTGEMLFFGYDIMGPPWLRYHVVDRDRRRSCAARTSTSRDRRWCTTSPSPSTTSCSSTCRSCSTSTSSASGRSRSSGGPTTARAVGVMPRDGGNADVRWLDVDLCYVYHPLNAYDDGDRVVVDVVRHPTMFANDQLRARRRARRRSTAGPSTVERREGASRSASTTILRSSRASTSASSAAGTATATRPTFVARRRRRRAVRRAAQARPRTPARPSSATFEAGQSAGEAVFVPASPDAGEDEGWLLSMVHDTATDKSDLVILDATDFTGPEVARVHLPQRVPYGFHGWWAADDDVGVAVSGRVRSAAYGLLPQAARRRRERADRERRTRHRPGRVVLGL